MTKIKRIGTWRWIAKSLQASVILGIPFIKIKGESALRFDIPSLRLHFFGVSLWMEEFFIVLAATLFLTFLVVFLTLMFGRIWCGWLCPQTVIVDYTRFAEASRNVLEKAGSYSALFLISSIVAANLIWYFVSPYEFFERLFSWRLGAVIWGFWIVLTGIIFLNFAFLRQRFCATVCPYAKLQSVLYDSKTLVIAFDPNRREECMNCMACVRICPVGIDVREGANAACVNCAECIDECTKMMGRKGKKSLVNYFFGLPGEGGRILRQNAIMIGAMALISFVFLLYLSFTRMLIDMTILPNYDFSPRITNNAAVNSYFLSVKNRGRSDEELLIGIKGMEGKAKITPDRIILKAGEVKKIPVFVTIGVENNGITKNIEIVIASPRDESGKITKKTNFSIPGA